MTDANCWVQPTEAQTSATKSIVHPIKAVEGRASVDSGIDLYEHVKIGQEKSRSVKRKNTRQVIKKKMPKKKKSCLL